MIPLEAIRALLDPMPVLEPGHVWLAGAGPGDPGHLTLHAVAGLVQADAVVHDALVDARVLPLVRPDAECIFAGKRGGKPSAVQADITARLVSLAREGKRVLRLKGGDPFMFGRGGEEILTLAREGIPFRVFPGITSGLAALAAASIPATMRGINQAIVFATGHGADPEEGLDWAVLARLGLPIVLYMGIAHLDRVATDLMAGGMSPEMPAAAIGSATLPEESVVVGTLRDLGGAVRAARLEAPAIVVIGEIVRVRAELLALAPRVRGLIG
jgi:uroporphyrin-III C-methyltransferase